MLNYLELLSKTNANKDFFLSRQVRDLSRNIRLIARYFFNVVFNSVFIMLGKFPILLASDVASRGIHVPNVHYVVNYDFPGSLDQVSYCLVVTSIYVFY